MKYRDANNSVYDITIRLLILLLIVVWCLLIMYPFMSIVLWSLILALAIHPLHTNITKKIGGRPKLASFIIVFTILSIVIVPSLFMMGSLIDEVKELKTSYDNGTLTIPPPTETVKDWPLIGEQAYETWSAISSNLQQSIIKYQDQLIETGGKLFEGAMGAISGVVQILVSLIIAGILLMIGGIGESIRKFFRKVVGERGDEFADIISHTIGNVVKGVLGVAFILALLHAAIFLFAGVPYAGIWTLIVLVLGILQIPVIFVSLPIIIYLFSVNDTMTAIIWTVLLIIAGLSDNVLKPILLGKSAPVPMLVIFIGVIGGFMFSGFIGLFTGAIVMSLGYKLFVSWINTDTEEIQENTISEA